MNLLIDATDLENQIEAFEKEANLLFPQELRLFLLKNNGLAYSYPSFNRMVDNTFEDEISLVEIMSFQRIRKIYFNMQKESSYTNAVPNAKLLPIGETIASPMVCIASSSDSSLHGKIYVWDGDFDATFQANSLAEFLGQLKEYQEV
jgi:SMI1 / KNR4 family (SUKH-1)